MSMAIVLVYFLFLVLNALVLVEVLPIAIEVDTIMSAFLYALHEFQFLMPSHDMKSCHDIIVYESISKGGFHVREFFCETNVCHVVVLERCILFSMMLIATIAMLN